MQCGNSHNNLTQTNNFSSLFGTTPYESPKKSSRNSSISNEDSFVSLQSSDFTVIRSATPEKYKNSLLSSLASCNSPCELVEEICNAQRRLLPNSNYALIFKSSHNHPHLFMLPHATHIVIQNLLGGVQSSVYRTEEITRENPLKRKHCVIKAADNSYSPVNKIFKPNSTKDPRIDHMLGNYTALDSNDHLAVFESSDGDLSGVDFRKRTLPVKYLVKQLTDHAGGLVYLHNNGIVHRDIKGDNLLVNDHGAGKVTDWGLAKLDDTNPHKIEGTLFYIPPFIWKKLEDQLSDIRQGYQGTEADVFSFGRTIQYDVVMLFLNFLAKKHSVNTSQLQEKISPTTQVIKNTTHLNELDEQYPFRIIITGQSGNLVANIFPARNQMLQDTLEVIRLFKQHLSPYEFDRLISLANLAYKLQACSPTELPKMSEVEEELKMIALAAEQQGAIEIDELIKIPPAKNKCALGDWAFEEKGLLFFYADDPVELENVPRRANLDLPSSPLKLRKSLHNSVKMGALENDSTGSIEPESLLFGSPTVFRQSYPSGLKV